MNPGTILINFWISDSIETNQNVIYSYGNIQIQFALGDVHKLRNALGRERSRLKRCGPYNYLIFLALPKQTEQTGLSGHQTQTP